MSESDAGMPQADGSQKAMGTAHIPGSDAQNRGRALSEGCSATEHQWLTNANVKHSVTGVDGQTLSA